MEAQYYIDEIRKLNDAKGSQKALIRTYGCQMNERDSEKIAGLLEKMGYTETNSEKDADLVIYNTCCVRENAENKIFGNLGRLKYYKDRKRDMKVVLCGCMAQLDGIRDIIKSKNRHVDIVFGTFNLQRFPELLHTNIVTGSPVIDIWEERQEITEDLPAVRKHGHKSGINIMYGCDNFCSYCIVPYVRGRERSREYSDIINEAKALANDGVKEVLLLGQNVNSYGKGADKPISFAKLLRKVAEVDGIERIRFMTSHPKDFSDELICAIAETDKVCKHVHLPLQSGSDEILEKMNRKYTQERYLSLVDKIREKIDNVSITTDIIVGFPGESEKDFLDTLFVVEQARFAGAFTFIYSKRSGTPAAKMEQLDASVVSERFDRLLAVQNNIVFEENEKYLGAVQRVLVDGASGKEAGVVSGRTDGNSLVHFTGGENLIGTIVDVKITKNRAFFLEGEHIGR